MGKRACLLRELPLSCEFLFGTGGGSTLLKLTINLLGDRTEREGHESTSPSGTVVLVPWCKVLLFATRGCLYTRVTWELGTQRIG